jgi:hypothetical protein
MEYHEQLQAWLKTKWARIAYEAKAGLRMHELSLHLHDIDTGQHEQHLRMIAAKWVKSKRG